MDKDAITTVAHRLAVEAVLISLADPNWTKGDMAPIRVTLGERVSNHPQKSEIIARAMFFAERMVKPHPASTDLAGYL